MRHVSIYDTKTGRRRYRHEEHQWQVAYVEFSPDGKRVASLADDIVLWDLDRKHVSARVATESVTTGLRFLPDGSLLVVDQGRVRICQADRVRTWPAPVGFRTRWCLRTTLGR